MDNQTKDQLRSVIVGLAIGDALGVPAEFQPRHTFRISSMTGYVERIISRQVRGQMIQA